MRHGDYDVTSVNLWGEFICGEKYLLFVSSEFLWIGVLGVKKEVIEKDINIERSWYHVRVEELIGLAHRGVSR